VHYHGWTLISIGIFNRQEKVNPLVVLVLFSFLSAPSVMTILPSHRDISSYLLFLVRWPWRFFKRLRKAYPAVYSLFIFWWLRLLWVLLLKNDFIPSSFWNKPFFIWYVFVYFKYGFTILLTMIMILDLGSTSPELKSGLLRVYSMRFCPYAQRTRLVLAAKQIQLDKYKYLLLN